MLDVALHVQHFVDPNKERECVCVQVCEEDLRGQWGQSEYM